MHIEDVLLRLEKSKFRRRFHLTDADKAYVYHKGMVTVQRHAEDFINKRLAPAYLENDGKQTPMKGHPVFLAQHATACCCRGCLAKWHHIPPYREMTVQEKEYVVHLLMAWIEKQMGDYQPPVLEYEQMSLDL